MAIYDNVGRWVDLKKPKTCWHNTWMVPSKIANAGPGYDEITLKLWKSSKLKFFENPFNMDKSVSRSIRNTMHKKGIKFAPVVELAKLKFTYIIVVK